jgi:hypothetical protein
MFYTIAVLSKMCRTHTSIKLHITVLMYIVRRFIDRRVDSLKCCFITFADESCGILDFVYLNEIFIFFNWELHNLHISEMF